MCLGQARLQFQGAQSQLASLFTPRGGVFAVVHNPAFQLRVAGHGQSKVGVQLNGALVQLFGLFELVEIHHCIGEIVRLHKSKVSLAVFGGSLRHLRFFLRRQSGLEGIGDLLRQIALNGEDIGELPVVIFRPQMLVGVGIDQLHVHAHAIADASHTAFQDRADPECFSDLARADGFAAILHDRRAGDHL